MKKFNFKKIFTSVVTAVIMVFSCFAFAACGDDKKEDTTPSTPAPTQPVAPTKAEALTKLSASITKINSLLTKENTGKISLSETNDFYGRSSASAEWVLNNTEGGTDIKIGDKFYRATFSQNHIESDSEKVVDFEQWYLPDTNSSTGHYCYLVRLDTSSSTPTKQYQYYEDSLEDNLYQIGVDIAPGITTAITEETISSVTLDESGNVLVVATIPLSVLVPVEPATASDTGTTEPATPEPTIDVIFTLKGDDIVKMEMSMEISETTKMGTTYDISYGNDITIPERPTDLGEPQLITNPSSH